MVQTPQYLQNNTTVGEWLDNWLTTYMQHTLKQSTYKSYQFRYGVFVWMTLVTGLRLGEVVGLRWCDIDFYTNILAKIVPNQSYSLEMLKSLYSHIYHMSVYFEQFLFSVVDTHDFQ